MKLVIMLGGFILKILKLCNVVLSRVLVFFIYIYRYCVIGYIRHSCKFIPTCSDYAIDCYNSFNVLKATYLVVWRIIRCNPFSKGGIDEVPKS